MYHRCNTVYTVRFLAQREQSMRTAYHSTHIDNWSSIHENGITPQELDPEIAAVAGATKGVHLDWDINSGWAGALAGWFLPEDEDATATVMFAFLEVQIPDDMQVVVDPQVSIIGYGENTAFIAVTDEPLTDVKLIDVQSVDV